MTFSKDPDYKRKLKKSTAPTKPTCYKRTLSQSSKVSLNNRPSGSQSQFQSSFPTPSPINNDKTSSRWSVDLDASFIDAGSHLV